MQITYIRKWTRKGDWDQAVILSRPARMAGEGVVIDNAITIRSTKNYSGSGPTAFGFKRGEKAEWPHVELAVSLPAGREDLAESLVKELMEQIDRFVLDNNLDGSE